MAVAASPHIYDAPQVGPPTSQTTLVGNGFDPNATLDLYFDSTDVGVVDTDNNGTFGLALKATTLRQNGATIQIPKDAVQGQHTITAVERITQIQAQVPFTVRTDWAKFHFDLGNTGFNPYENVLSPDTVGNLAVKWQYPTAIASPVVVNGPCRRVGAFSASPKVPLLCGATVQIPKDAVQGQHWITAVHDFTGGIDGGYPASNVSISTDGTLYGNAVAGGDMNCGGYFGPGCGVVWMIKP